MIERSLTITYFSNVSSDDWAAMVDEIMALVEQRGCDYAAAMGQHLDHYELGAYIGTMRNGRVHIQDYYG